MEGKLFINNYLEHITINFKNITEKEARKAAYYLLQSDEWKGFGADPELITTMEINLTKKDTNYLFRILYGQDMPTKELIRKAARGTLSDNNQNLSYYIIINEKQQDIKPTRIIKEEYVLINGNLLRTVEDALNNEIIKTNYINTNGIYAPTLDKLAQEDYENISLSHYKNRQYTLR
jgi:hypothetical protein